MYSDDATISEVQHVSKDMLVYFDDFCKKNRLTYTTACGTVLGGVRHKGFIPWDDDVDVSMHIDDIRKLVKIWDEKGDKENYFLQSKFNDPDISYTFWRFRKNNTTSMDQMFNFIKIHWGLPIDIFPIYNLPIDMKKQNKMVKLQKWTRQLSLFSMYFYWMPRFIKNWMNRWTCRNMERIIQLSDEAKDSDMILIADSARLKLCKKSMVFPVSDMPFEDVVFKGPADKHAYLTMEFRDYMTLPPVEKRGGHKGVFYDLHNDYSKYITEKPTSEQRTAMWASYKRHIMKLFRKKR